MNHSNQNKNNDNNNNKILVSMQLLQRGKSLDKVFSAFRWLFILMYNQLSKSRRYVQSLLAAGAVWLNLVPPRQPGACGPRAAVAGRDAAKLPLLPGEILFIIMELILNSNRETSKKLNSKRNPFYLEKTTEIFGHVRLQISALGRKFAISDFMNQLIQCWRSKFRFKVQGYL